MYCLSVVPAVSITSAIVTIAIVTVPVTIMSVIDGSRIDDDWCRCAVYIRALYYYPSAVSSIVSMISAISVC